MKKTLILVAGALIFGSFSFADAAVVYSQPTGSTSTSTPITLPVLRTAQSATWVAATAVNIDDGIITTQFTCDAGEFVQFSVHNVTDNITIIAENVTCTGSTQTSVSLGVGGCNQSCTTIVGKTYRVVVGPVVNPTDITYTYLENGSQQMYITLFDAGGGVVPPNWGAITVAPPLDWTAVQYVPTSTSFFSGQASGTLQALANECSETGNIFSNGICRAFAYMFSPNPAVLDQFFELPDLAVQKFPFSWVVGLQTTFLGFTASSSTMVSGEIDLSGVASTTEFGPIISSFTFISSSTITEYIPTPVWNAFQALMDASLWLALFSYVFFQARNRFRTRTDV